jgi:cysteine desulfurase/selenocysteine lyase
MPGLLPRTAFVGIDNVAHLATGGESPPLRTHLDAATRFLLDKGDGMPGRERFMVVAARVRQHLAELLHGEAREVSFLAHASQGLHAAGEGIDWRPGDNVVVEQTEFPSVLHVWQRLRDRGVEVRAVGDEPVVPEATVRAAVDARTRVIAVSLVSYLTGHRHDLRALRVMADRVGARLVTDVSHAMGVVPVDASLADVAVSCCYKWVLGTHGVGVFYVNRRRWPDLGPSWVGWHAVERDGDWRDRTGYRFVDDGRRFEAGNPSFISLYILDSGLNALRSVSPAAVEAHVLALGGELRSGLVKLGLPVLTPEAPEARAGNIVFAVDDAEGVERALRAQGILVWAGDGRVRLSVHLFNDEADVARALAALRGLDLARRV